MPFYKFMWSDHLEGLMCRGELAVTSLDYFGQLEWTDPGGVIGDFGERGSLIEADGIQIDGTSPLEDRAALARLMGVELGDGCRDFTISGQSLIATPHSLIYSFTEGDLDTQARVFCDVPGGYDAGVEITDPFELAREILANGRHVTSNPDDELPLSKLFTGGLLDKVQFAPRRHDFTATLAPMGGPFIKPTRFEKLREHRLVLPATGPDIHDQIILRIEKPERFFTPVFSHRHEAASAAPKPDLIAELCRLSAANDAVRVLNELERRKADQLNDPRIWTDLTPERRQQLRVCGEPANRLETAFLVHNDAFMNPVQHELMPDDMAALRRVVWRVRMELGLRSRAANYVIDKENGMAAPTLFEALTGERPYEYLEIPNPISHGIGRKEGQIATMMQPSMMDKALNLEAELRRKFGEKDQDA